MAILPNRFLPSIYSPGLRWNKSSKIPEKKNRQNQQQQQQQIGHAVEIELQNCKPKTRTETFKNENQ